MCGSLTMPKELGTHGGRPFEATLPKLSSAEANASRASTETLKVRCLMIAFSNHTEDFAYTQNCAVMKDL
jgi:hypothetical protein